MRPDLASFAESLAFFCREGSGVRHLPARGPAALCLLGPGITDADLQHEADAVTPRLPAAPVLALLQAPSTVLPSGPEELAHLLRATLRHHAVRPDLLALAREALPSEAVAERRFLSQALAHVLAQPPSPTGQADPGRAAGCDTPGLRVLYEMEAENVDPHEALTRCLAVFGDWRREHQGAFEIRPAQTEMAHAVLETLLAGETLLVEAGPGTGKSLAYALPAMLVALWRGERVLLSTQTRPLQQQLVSRELPALWECFGLSRWPRPDGRRGLRFAKLLGRSNYVCLSALRRWVRLLQDQGGSLEAAQLVLALQRHSDGCLDDLSTGVDPAILEALRSRRETCAGRACRGEPPCPVYQARETARQADVLVVNHAMLCADARLEGTVLGDWGALVVDEAHDLEPVATEALGQRLGAAQAETLQRAVGRLEAEVHEAFPAREPHPLQPLLQGLVDAAARVRQDTGRFLVDLDAALPREPRDPPRQRYRDPDEVFRRVQPQVSSLKHSLERLAEESEALVDACEAQVLESQSAGVLELAHVVRALSMETSAAFAVLDRGDDDEWVTFLDFGTPDAALRQIVALPVDVGAALQQLLARPQRGVVYTSATLCVDGDAGYVRRRLGVDPSAPTLFLPSPFDFAQQCTVACTASLGDYRDAGFVDAMADVLAALHTETGRRMLVLLTSHRMLRQLHAALLARLGRGAPLRSQGISGTREEIAALHVETSRGILLGTNSFWTGIDFPGEALEILVLAKLPFLPPDDPLVDGRCQRLRAEGEDPFESFILPEALLRFRQGLGRLIRSRQDRGAMVLLDRRVVTHAYGERFLAALPRGAQQFEAPQDLVAHVRDWFVG